MRKKYFLFIWLIIISLIIMNSEFLGYYFYIKKNKLDIDYFNSLQLSLSKKNLIAKSDFFNCSGDYCCKNIGFFLNKYKVKVKIATPITIFDYALFLVGYKIKGMWKIKNSYREFTVYFYFCRSLELTPGFKKVLSEKELRSRLIDGMEVIGYKGFYEVLGNFWYLRDNKIFHHCLGVVPVKALEEYRIVSDFSGKEKTIKSPSKNIFKKVCYYSYEFLSYFFDAITQTKRYIWDRINSF